MKSINQKLVSDPKEGPDDEAIEVTGEQIIAALQEREPGVSTVDVCRKHGISNATFCAWKVKFGGVEDSEAKRLKPHEDENA